MTSKQLFLGIDIGTSGIRAIVIDEHKTLIANTQAALPAPLNVANKGVEQHAEIWWQSLVTVIKNLKQQTSLTNLQSLALDGTSGTVLVTDQQGNPLAPALMYNDARSDKQVAQLAKIAPPDVPVHQVSAGLPKLMWLYEQPFAKDIHYALHQVDWIVGKLTGNFSSSDSNNCLKTGCDVINKDWPAWIHKTTVNIKQLPTIYVPGNQVGTVASHVARQLGIPDCVQVMAGTTDSTAAFIATGAQQTGDAVTSLGSTLVLKIIHDQPVHNSEYGIYSQPYFVQGKLKWLVGGASNSGGAVLRQYFSDQQMSALSAQIDLSRACTLDYYPLPRPGERFPISDPNKQPQLSPRPENDAEFLHELFAGIANIEAMGYKRLHELGAPVPQRVFSVGGGSKNEVWTRLRQSKLGCTMQTPQHSDAAYGAALLALHGCSSTA